MGKLSVSVEGMAAVEKERAKRKEELEQLIDEPFDINNKMQMDAVKKYTKQFEHSVNLMYLYHGMSEGASIGGGGWLLGYILPIPEFAKYFLTSFLYLGVIGFVLERFSMTDFYEQRDEMKALYNWCFKEGKEEYTADIKNDEKLAQPELQHLVKTIAPVCSVDFLQAWPRLTTNPEPAKTGWSGVALAGYSALSSTFSLFSNTKPRVDLTGVRELKVAVEKREFDIGILNGFKQAVSYFASNTDYADLMKSGVGVVKDMLPTVLTMTAAPK